MPNISEASEIHDVLDGGHVTHRANTATCAPGLAQFYGCPRRPVASRQLRDDDVVHLATTRAQ